MHAVDTNVLLRLTAGDDEKQASGAETFVASRAGFHSFTSLSRRDDGGPLFRQPFTMSARIGAALAAPAGTKSGIKNSPGCQQDERISAKILTEPARPFCVILCT